MRAKALPRGQAVLSVVEGYDRWAESYEIDGNPLTELEGPVVTELLGEVAGLEILDLGCGTGRHALWMAAAGASVTALDPSSGMLAQARAKAGAEAIRFVCHPAGEPLPFENGRFDRVLSSLVLEHVVDLDGFFGEIARVCRPGGFAVVTAMHPAMLLLGKQASFRDPATGEKLHPVSHPHQLSDFVMAALRAGLRVDGLDEHAVDADLAARNPRAEKHLGWLMLFVMRLSPPNRGARSA